MVGVLALQGDFADHVAALEDLDVPSREVRTAEELGRIDGLIIPGGESTSMSTLMDVYGLREPIVAYAKSGNPVWGTCAGMILMAGRLVEERPTPLGLMDLVVHRNAFGRQVDSFETDLSVIGLEGGPVRAVFIRAPIVCEIGPGVRVLATLENDQIVAAQQDHLLVTAFHPELTQDRRVHRYFAELVQEAATR